MAPVQVQDQPFLVFWFRLHPWYRMVVVAAQCSQQPLGQNSLRLALQEFLQLRAQQLAVEKIWQA